MESATVRFLCDDDENHGVESHPLSKVVTLFFLLPHPRVVIREADLPGHLIT